jgi:flagellar protein FlbD
VFILLSRGHLNAGAEETVLSAEWRAEPAWKGLDAMISLTRLNGQRFVINAEKIRMVETTPDTMVCCDTGEKMMVRETLEEVMRRAIDYARVIRRPITD